MLKGKNCTWGIGSSVNNCDIAESQSYKSDSANVVVNIPVTDIKTGTPYYVISGVKNNRLSSLVITYEK